jgi:hypothetical protein
MQGEHREERRINDHGRATEVSGCSETMHIEPAGRQERDGKERRACPNEETLGGVHVMAVIRRHTHRGRAAIDCRALSSIGAAL